MWGQLDAEQQRDRTPVQRHGQRGRRDLSAARLPGVGARIKDASGLTVNYQGIGSGGGIAQFTAKTVDFGATDSAMKDEEVAAAQKVGEPVHVPTVFGAVTVAYNAKGVENGLKLDGATVANVFLGKITKWNDPAIAALNPGVTLPSEDVTVCHRSDESGTTKLFTTFLNAYSPEWKTKVGSDKAVQWPVGTGAKGNDGVAACVKQNEGSFGYVEEAYALANNFTTADVKNKAGNFITASLASTSAAGEGLTLPEDLRFSAIDAPGAQAYPIASATFLLVFQDMCKAGLSESKAKDVKIWLDYALGDGQAAAPSCSTHRCRHRSSQPPRPRWRVCSATGPRWHSPGRCRTRPPRLTEWPAWRSGGSLHRVFRTGCCAGG